MIELKDVTIAYDRVILDHASFSIPAHSITLLRGKSGSGKKLHFFIVLPSWIIKAVINIFMMENS